MLSHPAAEQFKMGPPDHKQVAVVLVAPLREDPKIGGVTAANPADLASEERCNRDSFSDKQWIPVPDDLSSGKGGVRVGHGGPPW